MGKYINKNFGNFIRTYRKRLGMTQDVLASKLGYVTRASISRIENGLNIPNPVVIQKMAEVFKCPVEEILHAINVDEENNGGHPQVLSGTVYAVPTITEQKEHTLPGAYAFDKAILGLGEDYSALQLMIAPNNALAGLGISKGDYVIVNVDKRAPLDGEPVVLKKDNTLFLRKARYDDERNGIEYVYCTDKYSYPTFFEKFDEENPEVEVIGTCLSVVHKLPITPKIATIKKTNPLDKIIAHDVDDVISSGHDHRLGI